MGDEKLPRPSNAEMEILQVLWRLQPCTVRQVHEALNESRETPIGSYTTPLKLLQIMTEKGLVVRDDSQRPQTYRASLAREETQRQMVHDLLGRVFGGSAKQMIMQALATTAAPASELDQIEQLLDRLEDKK